MPALGGGGEWDFELLGETAEDGFVDVVDAVGGAEDEDLRGFGFGGVREETIPVGHKPELVSVVLL